MFLLIHQAEAWFYSFVIIHLSSFNKLFSAVIIFITMNGDAVRKKTDKSVSSGILPTMPSPSMVTLHEKRPMNRSRPELYGFHFLTKLKPGSIHPSSFILQSAFFRRHHFHHHQW